MIIINLINIIIVGAIESVRRRSLSAPGLKVPQVKGIQVGNMPARPGRDGSYDDDNKLRRFCSSGKEVGAGLMMSQ